ncbi:DUF6232 family protein [Plantactinospora sp. WMMB334]|uniref:DUF6232 family protein n=1 Tax=Plantactinospora sp. WMMB334 TaxID=3404119 RepID=UPI003B930B88
MEPTRPPVHLPDASFEVSGPGRPRPVDLYRQPGVRVTSEAFFVAGRKFPITELTHLQTARGPHDRLTLRAVGITAAVLIGIGIALGYTGDLYRLPATTYAGLGLAAFVPVGLALAGARWRPPAYELWGRHKGDLVLLFSSDHERQFGQVTRALIRAREAARLGGLAYPPASTTPYEPMS